MKHVFGFIAVLPLAGLASYSWNVTDWQFWAFCTAIFWNAVFDRLADRLR